MPTPSQHADTTNDRIAYDFRFSRNLKSTVHEDSVALRTEVFVHEQHVPVELEVDADEDRCLYIVAYDLRSDPPHPAATLRLLPESYGLHVQRVAVAKDHRGTGLGRALVEQAHAYAQRNGVHQLRLNAQTHATGFYESLGYLYADRPEFLDAGIPHRAMYRDL